MTLVERLLPQARDRLVTIGTEAPLIEAAELLRAGTDIIVVCDPQGLLTGVITKTDVVGGGFKWSSQHGLCELFGGTGPEPRPVFSSQGSFAACC